MAIPSGVVAESDKFLDCLSRARNSVKKFARGEKVPDFLSHYLHEIISFVCGAGAGAAGGSLLTLRITKKYRASGGSITDQSRARAGGDVVGGNKTTTVDRPK